MASLCLGRLIHSLRRESRVSLKETVLYVCHCVLDFIAMRGRHVHITNLYYSGEAACLMIAMDIIHDDHDGLAIARVSFSHCVP